jgi:uncharacterized membrane protein YcaP (DUF421 family)
VNGMLWSGWETMGRTLVVGSLVYIALVALLRVSGKRTLSKLNAFDLVVTVAIGSTLASAFLQQSVSFAQAALGLALLVAFQFAITWLSVRLHTISRLVKSEPRLLLKDGQFLDQELRTARVTREEILQALRSQGQGRVESIRAVVLETDGTMSVIAGPEKAPLSALGNVVSSASGPG